MLVLKLELWPGGDGKKAKSLGVVRIAATDPSKMPVLGSYYIVAELADDMGPSTLTAEILEYPRQLGAWELVRRALDAISHKRVKRAH